jgi:hypothetical protein
VLGSTISGFKRKTHTNLDKGGNYEKYFSKRLFSPIVRQYPPGPSVLKKEDNMVVVVEGLDLIFHN